MKGFQEELPDYLLAYNVYDRIIFKQYPRREIRNMTDNTKEENT